MIERRDFTTLLGGTAAAWPLAAGAPQGKRIRRVGALMGWSDNDKEYGPDFAALVQGLAQMGWPSGSNSAVEFRWTMAVARMYERRTFVDGGGLISYASEAADTYHREGVYVGRSGV